MDRKSRRTFLKQTGAGAASLAALNLTGPANAAGAGETIVMGAIGLGGQGTNLARSFSGQKDVRMAYVCDPDINRANRAAKTVEGITGKAPKIVTDLRRILEDKSVDAITVATPDHWHGPATLLALEHGKHVYVEKPCAHTSREGRLMVEAAR